MSIRSRWGRLLCRLGYHDHRTTPVVMAEDVLPIFARECARCGRCLGLCHCEECRTVLLDYGKQARAIIEGVTGRPFGKPEASDE